MSDKKLQAGGPDRGAANSSGLSESQQLAAKIVKVDRRRLRLLTAVTMVLWTITLVTIVFMAFFYMYWLAPKLRAYAEGQHEFQADANIWLIVGDWCARIVMASVVCQLLAALSTISLIQASRSATLRQLNANLTEISDQLKSLRNVSRQTPDRT